MKRQYKYDAFISYRHADLDKFVAETLHKELESYKVPTNALKKTGGRKKIERVFRDQDELPLANNLEDPIKQALSESEYLIVICTPRLKESMWCQKEIDTFIEMHGRKNIFVVLAEGEPDEVFPEQLMHGTEVIIHENGTTETVEKHWEPLAADVRGKDKKAVKKAIKTEMLRLIAPMFSVDYDDLRQRHRERAMRKIFRRAAIVTGISLLFGVISSGMAINIALQKNQIKKQNQEIKEQSAEIVTKNLEIKKQNDLLAVKQAEMLAQRAEERLNKNDREAAIEDAYSALTTYEGIEMPYVAEAQEVLTSALHVYDTGRKYEPAFYMNVDGELRDGKPSVTGTYFALSDNLNSLYVYRVEDKELLQKIDDIASDTSAYHTYVFLDDDKLAFIASNGAVYLNSISQEKNQIIQGVKNATSVYRDPDGKSLWVSMEKAIVKVDVESLKITKEIPLDSDLSLARILSFGEKGDKLIYAISPLGNNQKIIFLDLNSGDSKEISSPEFLGKISAFNGHIFIVGAVPTENIVRNDSVLYCYDEETFELQWEITLDMGSAEKVYQAPEDADGDLALVEAGSWVYVIRWKTGEVVKRVGLDSTIVGVYRVQGQYLMFTRDGRMVSFGFDDEKFNEISIYQVKDGNIKDVYVCNDMIVAIPYMQKGALVSKRFNVDVYDTCEGEMAEPLKGHCDSEEKEALFAKYDIPDIAWIEEILVIEEDKKAIISYKDHKVIVYDLETNSVYRQMEISNSAVEYYYGKDKAGNCYVGGPGCGYMLNSDYELIATIERMGQLLPEENMVVLDRYSDEHVLIPIYSLEELLAMAEEIVLK